MLDLSRHSKVKQKYCCLRRNFELSRLFPCLRASLVAQMVEHPPAMRETGVQCLGWEDPLEKEMATHSNNLAWRILWMEEPDGLVYGGSQRVRHS